MPGAFAAHANQVRALLGFAERSLCYSPFSLFYSLLLLAECAEGPAVRELEERLHFDRAEAR